MKLYREQIMVNSNTNMWDPIGQNMVQIQYQGVSIYKAEDGTTPVPGREYIQGRIWYNSKTKVWASARQNMVQFQFQDQISQSNQIFISPPSTIILTTAMVRKGTTRQFRFMSVKQKKGGMLVWVGSQDRRPGLLFTSGAHLNSRLRLYQEKELGVGA